MSNLSRVHRTHRCLSLATWIALALPGLIGARMQAAEPGGLHPVTVQQITALWQEKLSRTPVQLKLDSHLVLAVRYARNETLGGGVPRQRSNFTPDAQGRVQVDIRADVTPGLLDLIAQSGMVVNSHPRYKAIRAWLPLESLESLAARQDVHFIQTAVPAMTRGIGRLTSEGDVTHRGGEARTNFSVMGEGVKVGVLSDSVNTLGSLDSAINSGDVVGVTVLPGQGGVGADEGTAMLEIIADIAPKAELFYATAIGSPAGFAQNIIDLRLAGCDVIVDDVGYASEFPFQDDEIAQAVNIVTADGAMYFSSAGNSGNKNDNTSAAWEGDFRAGATMTLSNRTGVVHTYGNTVNNRVTTDAFSVLTTLHWSDPLRGSTNDYDLFVVDSNNNVVASSTMVQNGNDDAYENVVAPDGNFLVILRVSGEIRFMHLELFGAGENRLEMSTEGIIKGHNSTTNGFGVAAVNVALSFPGAFIGGAANPVENFSSDGPRRVFFDSMGNPLTAGIGNLTATGGVLRLQPEIAAADGVMTTVTPRGGGFNPFFGTSAAAPHAAAIAALILSYNPGLTAAQVRTVLTNTALDIEGPGMDRDSGWGILDPFAALSSVPAPLPTLVSSNLTGGNFNGIIDVNECNELELTLKNNAISTATAVSASLVTATPGVTVVIGTAQYPNLLPGSTGVNTTPFRFYTDPSFICGTPIDFTLRIASSLGSVTNNFRMLSGRIGSLASSFTNAVPAIIPPTTNGLDYFIPVSGILGSIGKVVVTVHITHPTVEDLRLDLFTPDDATRVVLVAGRGGSNANFGVDCQQPTVFDDAAATNITAGFAPFAGAFQPQQRLSSFGGKFGAGANGQWRLNVRDLDGGRTGAVECVTITIFPALCTDGGGDCSADVGVSIVDSPDPVLVGSNLTYTLTVLNRSTHLAPGTTLLDTLPPGVTILSATTTRGSCSASASSVNCALGTLSGNGSATIRITVRPTVAGLITNFATVTSLAFDTNPFDNTDAELTSVENPRPIIAPFATSLLAESGPVSGGLEPGETVTISFSFRNIGTLDTTNLGAQLLTKGGVTNVSDPQVYGALVANGLSVARPFTFTATGTNGGIVVATFQLQDGTNDLGEVSFPFALGGGAGYANRSVINIPDSGAAALYPSPVFVTGLVGSIARVTVTLSNLTHSFPEDLDILLVSPGGQKVLLLSDAGASLSINNVTLTFDDAAPAVVPSGSAIISGAYRPSDYPPTDDFNGVPAGPYATALAAFNGTGPNGTWGLYLFDDEPGDAGRLAGGWSLEITTFDPINPHAELSVTASDAPDPVKLGSNLTYTVTVANNGPEVALGVVLTNLLPSGVAFVSATSSQGVCSNDLGTVFCELGTLAVGNSAVVTVLGTATGLGAQTFTARVSGGVADFSPGDDIAIVTTFIEANADLTVALSSLPKTASVNSTLLYFVAVTNLGPNAVSGVTVTNVLPPGVAFVSASGSQGAGCTESGGTVVCDLGAIAVGGSAAAVITILTPAAVTPLTNTAFVSAASPPDPDLSNNQATLVVNSLNPSFVIEAAMTFLVSESGPITGGMEPGEIVAVNFLLRNVGQQPTANLVATLLPLGGVTAPGGPQNYGVIDTSGVAVGRTNTFTVGANPGPVLTATLRLQDGPFDLGTVSFEFPVGGTTRFTNAAPILTPGFGKSLPYPSTLEVAGLTGVVGKVTLTLAGLRHTYPDDLDVLLVSPTGRVVMALSDAGGGNGLSGVTLTFDDDAPAPAPNSTALMTGVYQPTDYTDLVDALEPPAPAGPYVSALATFQGIDPNGTWSLYIYDDFFQDQGDLAGGWSLDITTVGIIDPQPALLLAGRFLPAGGFEFMLKGVVGGKYEIQSSSNFQNWSRVADTTLTRSNTVIFVDPGPPASAPRFYRAIHRP